MKKKVTNLPSNIKLQVFLIAEKGLGLTHMADVHRWFTRHPGPISVKFLDHPITLDLNEDGILLWEEAFSKLILLRTEYHDVPSDSFLFLLTKSPNEHNWYTVQDPDNIRNGFCHVGDFKWVTSAPPSVISTHYLLKNIFNALLADAGIDIDEICHRTPRGCFFDFCEQKAELNLKLRTADICGDCMQVFHEIGIPDSLLRQTVKIMDSCRPLTLNTGQFRDEKCEFDRWPFPVAVTRHKVVQATDPRNKFSLLLKHFDCLIRYFFLTKEVWEDREPEIIARPSLGWWFGQLAHSLKTEGESNYRKVIRTAEKNTIVKTRNELAHGYMGPNADDEKACKEGAQRLEEDLTEIEEVMTPFFEKLRLIIPRKIDLKLTCILNLSEEPYEGGSFFKINEKEEIKFDSGMGLIFNSLIAHKVTPVTKGERITLTYWGEGPPWR